MSAQDSPAETSPGRRAMSARIHPAAARGLRLINGRLRYRPGGIALTAHQIALARVAFEFGVATITELTTWSGIGMGRMSAIIRHKAP